MYFSAYLSYRYLELRETQEERLRVASAGVRREEEGEWEREVNRRRERERKRGSEYRKPKALPSNVKWMICMAGSKGVALHMLFKLLHAAFLSFKCFCKTTVGPPHPPIPHLLIQPCTIFRTHGWLSLQIQNPLYGGPAIWMTWASVDFGIQGKFGLTHLR